MSAFTTVLNIGKLKETLKYINYFLFSSLALSLFVQELDSLKVNLTSHISYLQNVHCNKFKHKWLDKTLIA